MKRACLVLVALAALAAPAAAAAEQGQRSLRLAVMPLPKPALGELADGLRLRAGSGVITNAAAASSARSGVTRAQLTRLGRVTGYTLDYADPAAALARGRGVVEVQTTVELYRDERAARRALAFWRRDETRNAAGRGDGTSVSLAPLRTRGLGDGSFGFARVAKEDGEPPVYSTEVEFRTGRLLATVSVGAADRGRSRPVALSLARKLDRRIALVLAGKIEGPPVPLPPAPHGRPASGVDLSTLALTPRDLGKARVVRQGYQPDHDLQPISEYRRSMRPAGRFAYLDEEVALYHSPTEASYTLAFLVEVLSSGQLVQTFAASVRDGGLVASYHAARVPAVARVGDEARGIVARVRLTDGRRLDEGFAFVRIGSATVFLSVASPFGGRLTATEVTHLAAKAASRAQTGLRRARAAR